MRRLVLIALLLIAMVAPVAAQNACQQNLPCQQVPWSLPVLPQLYSPTPLPSMALTSSGLVVTGTATATPAPSSTPTAAFNMGAIADPLNTLAAMVEVTDPSVEATDNFTDSISDNAAVFFGYARGLGDVHLGAFTPLLTFLVSAFAFVLLLVVVVNFAKLFAPLLGLVRKVVEFVAELLPG